MTEMTEFMKEMITDHLNKVNGQEMFRLSRRTGTTSPPPRIFYSVARAAKLAKRGEGGGGILIFLDPPENVYILL